MNQNITKDYVYSFLNLSHLAVIGTTSPNNIPHLTTMFYVVDQELNFYFITRSETQKAKNIAIKPYAAIVVSDMNNYITVEAHGRVLAVDDVGKIKSTVEMFNQLYKQEGLIEKDKLFNWPPPIEKIESGEITIFMLKPEHLQYDDYSKNSPLGPHFVQDVISS